MSLPATLYDARGNEILCSYPDITTGQTFTDGRTISATLGALNAETLMDLMGTATVTFDVRTAAASLTYLCEGTIDGTNYFAVPMFANFQVLAAALVAEQYVGNVVVATTHSGSYTVGTAGIRRLRLRVSAYTSGNITVSARGSTADLVIYGRPVPATLFVTVTAAANTAATITLPAVPGCFHYITYLNCRRNSTAVLAGTATLIITTTNLPGSPAWSSGNVMAAGDTKEDVNYVGAPLKSLVVNTNTTIVMPAAGLAVLNRGNCAYYVGA